jgi:hypothetical protein
MDRDRKAAPKAPRRDLGPRIRQRLAPRRGVSRCAWRARAVACRRDWRRHLLLR